MAMPSTELQQQHLTGEHSEVFRWRERELRRAGFSEAEARELAARGDIDLRGAIELLRKGCPHDIAYRILV